MSPRSVHSDTAFRQVKTLKKGAGHRAEGIGDAEFQLEESKH
jgi:hypothetical protein